jgi:hypothetical protein
MTDSIEEYERVRPDQTLWVCPECGGVLEPLGDPDRDKERNKEDWWDNPTEWADDPAVDCIDCRQRFRVQFIPVV